MTTAISATARRARRGSDVVVLSVPTDHVYVRHLSTLPGQTAPCRVVRLRDPQDPWWPPPALEPDWLAERTDEFDLLHLHFGFDARSVEELQAVIDILRDAGRPLVQTVHDYAWTFAFCGPILWALLGTAVGWFFSNKSGR